MFNNSDEYIELYMTTWISETSNLFDFNSASYQQENSFKAVTYDIQLPPRQKVFYFFHMPIERNQKHKIRLERRFQQYSYLQCEETDQLSYKLLGGVQIMIDWRKSSSKITVKPLSAKNIKTRNNSSRHQREMNYDPYLVIRTFGDGFQLKVGQILKMGKLQFNIDQLVDGSNRQTDINMFQPQQILNLDEMKQNSMILSKKQTQHQKVCKICYFRDQDDQNYLISPCNCDGSMKYIHTECLKKWVTSKMKKLKNQGQGGMYQLSRLNCEICHTALPKIIIKNKKIFTLLKFLQDANPYVAIKLIQDRFRIEQEQENQFSFLNQKLFISFQDKNQVRIGRLDQNGVIFMQTSVSRNHALLQKKEHKIMIKDRKSKYGTLIQDPNAVFKLPLDRMRALQIGSTVFGFTKKKKSYYALHDIMNSET